MLSDRKHWEGVRKGLGVKADFLWSRLKSNKGEEGNEAYLRRIKFFFFFYPKRGTEITEVGNGVEKQTDS